MSQPSSSLIEYIYKMAGVYRNDVHSDAELLSRYAINRDEEAFYGLMARHGAVVWNICRRILKNTEDVEEAYQTAFLALACKATKIHVTDTLAGWLHQVAHRTAMAVRKQKKTRQKVQESLKTLMDPDSGAVTYELDTYEELHGEIAKLPEKVRVAIVLHYMEGKTQAEVAHILAVDESAVWQRINRGKAILEKRLSQHGLAIGAGTLNLLLAESTGSSAMPPGLVSRTMQAALAFRDGNLSGGLAKLAQEVLQRTPSTAPWWKTAWMIAFLWVSGLGMGLGAVAWKAGYFRTKAGGPPNGVKQQAAGQVNTEKPKSKRTDLYGDSLPPEALARLGTTRFRCYGQDLLFTPDGKGLFMCGIGSPARHCDATTGRVLGKFGKDVRAIALSRDGRALAGRSPDNEGGLCLWDVATGKVLQQIQGGDMDWYVVLALSPDSKMAASMGQNSKARAWEVGSGKMLWERKANSGWQSIVYSEDGKHILQFDEQGLHILDALTGEQVRHFGKKDQRMCLTCACSPDTRVAAIAYSGPRNDGPVNKNSLKTEMSLWEVASGKELHRFADSKAWPNFTALAFSPDAKTLATTSGLASPTSSASVNIHEDIVRLWDVATGKELRRCTKLHGWIGNLAFSPNGKMIAATNCIDGDRTVHLWDVGSGKEIPSHCDGHTGTVTSLAFGPDGKEIVSCGNDGVLRIWTTDGGVQRLQWKQMTGDTSPSGARPSLAPDGRTAAAIELTIKDEEHVTGAMTISCRAEKRFKELYRFPMLPQIGYYLSFSPNGKILACSGGWGETSVHLWNLSTGEEFGTVDGDLVAFSSDGRFLASRRHGKPGRVKEESVSIWDIHTCKEICLIQAIEDNEKTKVEALAFSPEGRMLATVVSDGKIQLWRLPDYKASIVVRGCLIDVIESDIVSLRRSSTVPLVFSPDGRMLATSDNSSHIKIWETATGKERCQFEGHENDVLSLIFAPEGRRLASGGKDTSILIWDVTGRTIDQAGEMPRSHLTAHDMETIWGDLIDKDAKRAARAAWMLASAGNPAVTFLKERLKPVPRKVVDEKIVARRIAELNSTTFAVRERAQKVLKSLGNAVESHLTQSLRERPSPEKRRSLEQLLAVLDVMKVKAYTDSRKGEGARSIRAIEVLGHIATSEAKKVMHALAGGDETAPQTQTARYALEKLSR